MYPTEEAVPGTQPQAFVTIELCLKEIDRLENKIQPILSMGNDKLAGGATPSMTELDSLNVLLDHIRELSKRVKI